LSACRASLLPAHWRRKHLDLSGCAEVAVTDPVADSDEIIHAETLRQLNNYMDNRRARLNSVAVGIPAVLWWVVGIGAVIAVLLVARLDMEIHVHLILGAAPSMLLGLVIFLITRSTSSTQAPSKQAERRVCS
jgi:hypothetical protein